MFAKQSQYNSKNRNCFTCSAQQHLFLKCPTEDKGCDSVDIQMSLIRSFLNIQSQWPNSDLWNMCISFDEVIENSMHIIWRQNFTLGISSTKTRQNCQWPPSNVCYLKCHSFPYTLKIMSYLRLNSQCLLMSKCHFSVGSNIWKNYSYSSRSYLDKNRMELF